MLGNAYYFGANTAISMQSLKPGYVIDQQG